MEIERKWMVKGWPEGLPLREEFAMRQGYISVRPTVRIRKKPHRRQNGLHPLLQIRGRPCPRGDRAQHRQRTV